MVDMFEERICNYCKKTECNKEIEMNVLGEVKSFKCKEYEKDSTKVIPYETPLVVTAKRDYTSSFER